MTVRYCPSGSVSQVLDCARALLTTSTSADVYGEAEPLLAAFCFRRPLTRAWCGGGIALSHQRVGSSAVSAGGTDPCEEPWARSVWTRRAAAGWAGASSGG